MTMNKRERAALEYAEARAALRWSDPRDEDLRPDIDPDALRGEGGHAEGWDTDIHRARNTSGGIAPSRGVFRAWTTSNTHGERLVGGKPCGGSRKGRALYSDRVVALRALRRDVEIEAAEALRAIDLAIEEARTS